MREKGRKGNGRGFLGGSRDRRRAWSPSFCLYLHRRRRPSTSPLSASLSSLSPLPIRRNPVLAMKRLNACKLGEKHFRSEKETETRVLLYLLKKIEEQRKINNIFIGNGWSASAKESIFSFFLANFCDIYVYILYMYIQYIWLDLEKRKTENGNKNGCWFVLVIVVIKWNFYCWVVNDSGLLILDFGLILIWVCRERERERERRGERKGW